MKLASLKSDGWAPSHSVPDLLVPRKLVVVSTLQAAIDCWDMASVELLRLYDKLNSGSL